MPAGQPKMFKTPEDLDEACNRFFKYCDEHEKPYTITGLALYLNTNRTTLLNYKTKYGKEYLNSIKKALAKCENYAEDSLFSGKQATGPIFNLKNNYGWKDSREIEIPGVVDFADRLSKALSKRAEYEKQSG